MGITLCNVCNRYFNNPDGFWRCWICFKKNKQWKLTKGDQALDAQIDAIDSTYRQNLKMVPKNAAPRNVLRLDDLAKDRIKKLIRLCHPDKHVGRSKDSAQEITTWLLGIHKKMK
jgi:hypothetical protein